MDNVLSLIYYLEAKRKLYKHSKINISYSKKQGKKVEKFELEISGETNGVKEVEEIEGKKNSEVKEEKVNKLTPSKKLPSKLSKEVRDIVEDIVENSMEEYKPINKKEVAEAVAEKVDEVLIKLDDCSIEQNNENLIDEFKKLEAEYYEENIDRDADTVIDSDTDTEIDEDEEDIPLLTKNSNLPLTWFINKE